VASNRQPLSNVGKGFGCQFFRVEQADTNPNHANEVLASEANNDLDLVLNRSPRRYKVNGIDITAVEIGENAEGASVVYINRGRKKVVGNKEFSQEAVVPVTSDMKLYSNESDDQILKAALKGDNSKVFADIDTLVEKMNALNDNEVIRIEKVIKALEAQKKMIIDTKNSNIDKARRYRAERTGVTNNPATED
jgi:hypothetical protein